MSGASPARKFPYTVQGFTNVVRFQMETGHHSDVELLSVPIDRRSTCTVTRLGEPLQAFGFLGH